jgi:DNA-binding NtrC family response regulator
VLLVDDNDGFRSALAWNLRDDGHDVREYGSPSALPPLATLPEVTIVVTDYEMPGSDGLALADAFHETRPQVPIVLVTAQWNSILRAQAAARDFLEVRRKPFDYDELHALLHRLSALPQA